MPTVSWVRHCDFPVPFCSVCVILIHVKGFRKLWLPLDFGSHKWQVPNVVDETL